MDRPLPVVNSAPTRTCVWVDAGLLTFRLCDRDFACEQCPLDAAIRSAPWPHAEPAEDGAHRPTLWHFPEDRGYTAGHWWAQTLDSTRTRLGLDAFAMRLISTPRSVRCGCTGTHVSKGEALCVLGLDCGELAIPAPLTGRLLDWNRGLARDPSPLFRDPYGEGWLAEIALPETEPRAALLDSDGARAQARLDLRRFGRRAAFGLLSMRRPEEGWGTSELLDAMHHAVGDAQYLDMVRDAMA
jgi:glycine cleavage system H protein